MKRLRQWVEQRFTGHITLGCVTIYGANAMHYAVNIECKQGYWCFRLPIKCFETQWGWYVYYSPNATPWQATFAIGSGIGKGEKREAWLRRKLLGWSFPTDEPLAQPHALANALFLLGHLANNRAFLDTLLDAEREEG